MFDIQFPKIITSSVIRSSQQGESHGGVYLVDLNTQEFQQVIDWNDQSISWEGRGWDRGLRGIAFYEDMIYLAASDEVFIYDQQFNIVASIRNPYLKHCHEICIDEHRLYLTSTGFDAILEYDLSAGEFSGAWYFVQEQGHISSVFHFNPMSDKGPGPSMSCHINSVTANQGEIDICGTRINTLVRLGEGSIRHMVGVPYTTHNARLYGDGVLCNDTASDRVAYYHQSGELLESFPVVYYPEEELRWTHLTQDRARQAFARGLCISDQGLIIAGSSPSTISVYQHGNTMPLLNLQLSNDIRNSIHGLEIWPF